MLEEEAFGFLTRRSAVPVTNGQTLEEVERAHILRIFEQCEGNHSKTARILDIDRTTLYAKLKRYGVNVPPP